MRSRRTYYELLHVQPDAPLEIIHMSYLTLMRRLRMHPDLGGDHRNATLINEAYATLKDAALRAAYDRKLKRRAAAARGDAPAALKSAATTAAPTRPCAFCEAPHAVQSFRAAGARCDICRSPLRPAERYLKDAPARRALERIVRRMPMTFALTWSPLTEVAGLTEDISISGMQLTTGLELLVDERLKIECAFCSAVGIVRHVRVTRAKQPRWRVGVEFLTLMVKDVKGGIINVRA